MRFFYGYVIAAVALVALMFNNGLVAGGINAFDPSLVDAFGWDRSTVGFRGLLTFALGGLLAPFAGALADRYGVKRLMIFGSLLLAACFVGYSKIESATGAFLIHALFAVALVSCGLIVVVMLISRWFVRRRGAMIGLALTGTSLGGVVFPKLGHWLIEEFGWRRAFQIEALIPLALVVIVLLLVRETPAEMKLDPLGALRTTSAEKAEEAEETEEVSPANPASGFGYREALSTASFWALATTGTLTFFAILAAKDHLILYSLDIGLDRGRATTALSLLFGTALIGKVLFGVAADRLSKLRVLLVNIVIMLIGMIALASFRPQWLLPAAGLIGLGWGGLYTLLQVLVIDRFGLRAAGKILGTVVMLDAVAGGLGSWLAGRMYDARGDYRLAFGVLVATMALALLAATRIGSKLPELTEPKEPSAI